MKPSGRPPRAAIEMDELMERIQKMMAEARKISIEEYGESPSAGYKKAKAALAKARKDRLAREERIAKARAARVPKSRRIPWDGSEQQLELIKAALDSATEDEPGSTWEAHTRVGRKTVDVIIKRAE